MMHGILWLSCRSDYYTEAVLVKDSTMQLAMTSRLRYVLHYNTECMSIESALFQKFLVTSASQRVLGPRGPGPGVHCLYQPRSPVPYTTDQQVSIQNFLTAYSIPIIIDYKHV